MDVVEKFRAKVEELNQLGSPGNVAAFLKEKGVRGVRRAPQTCPIATYLQTELFEPDDFSYRVVTGLFVVTLYPYRDPEPHLRTENVNREGGIRVDLSRGPRTFVQAFDNGLYPELER